MDETKKATEEDREKKLVNKWVTLCGLDTYEPLNGCVGLVLGDSHNGRFPIGVAFDDIKLHENILCNPKNFVPVTEGDMVDIVRLNCLGENRTEVTPLRLPRQHPLFAKAPADGNSPVAKLLGVPLFLQKTEPIFNLRELCDFENHWATWLMIEPSNFLAPRHWEAHVGPVLVCRPDRNHLSTDDVTILVDVISCILNEAGDHPNVDISHERLLHEKEKYVVKRLMRHAEPTVNF